MIIDITGKTYGRLKVLGLDHIDRQARWLCQCSCKQRIVVSGYDLRIGHTTSCGCRKRELTSKRRKTHGLTGSRAYRIWARMKNRCYNEKSPDFPDYGGRGIKVCARWKDSFENFLEDMGHPPTLQHSIDRRDGRGGYGPTNCRWATPVEQANNKSNNRILRYNGQRMSLAQVARACGINQGTLRSRLDKYGWSLNKATAERRSL